MSESNIIIVQTVLNISFHVSYTPLGKILHMSWLDPSQCPENKMINILHKQSKYTDIYNDI